MGDRHASWLELFLDLVYVAAIGALATTLGKTVTPESVGRFFLLFVPIWWTWVGHVFFSTRFDTDDGRQRLFTFGQMVGVVAMAVHAPTALDGGSNGFVWAYVGTRAVLVAQYLFVAKALPEARDMALTWGAMFAFAASLWAASLLLPVSSRPVVWALALAIDLATPVVWAKKAVALPPHYAHVPERFGLFTIIVLGEAVIATVQGLRPTTAPNVLALALVGMVGAFAFWWDYFDGARGAKTRPIRSVRAARRFRTWMYLHLPLHALVPIVAVGFKHFLTLEPGKSPYLIEAWTVAGAGCALCVLLNLIWMTSPVITAGRSYARQVAKYWVAPLLPFLGPLLAPGSPLALVGAVTAAFVIRVLFEMYDYGRAREGMLELDD